MPILHTRQAHAQRTMKRISLFFPEQIIERLRAIADGRPIAELIRTAVVEYVEKRELQKR